MPQLSPAEQIAVPVVPRRRLTMAARLPRLTRLTTTAALRRRLTTAAWLPGLIRLIATAGPRRRWTTAARLPLFIRLAVAAAPHRRLTTATRLPRFIRLAVTGAGGNRGIYTLLVAIIARLSSRSPTNERACRFVSISPKSLSSCQATRLATSRPYSQAIAHSIYRLTLAARLPRFSRLVVTAALHRRPLKPVARRRHFCRGW